MTPPESDANTTPGPRRVTIGKVTVDVAAPTEAMLVSIDLRFRTAERRGSDEAIIRATLKVLEEILSVLVVDPDQAEEVIDEIAAGRVGPDELIKTLLGMDDGNRAERRQEQRATRRSTSRRRR